VNYFLCPNYSTWGNRRPGGIKTIESIVDCLNNNGHTSSMIYPEHLITLSYTSDDVFVIPEVFAVYIMNESVPKTSRKIILNQGVGLTLQLMSEDQIRSVYSRQNYNITDVIFVSDQNIKVFKQYVPKNINIHKIHNFINNKYFYYSPNKKIQIAFMPRKGIDFIRKALSKIDIKEIPFVYIADMPLSQVGEIMRESLIFLSWSDIMEGFFLPPAEAMACGCMVIGNVPGGANDFMFPEYCYPLTTKIHQENANRMILHVVNEFKTNPQNIYAKGKKASDFILNNYNYNVFKNDVLSIFSN
jgi:glycosyltransferase involved in cell wall biosynthesis